MHAVETGADKGIGSKRKSSVQCNAQINALVFFGKICYSKKH